MLGVLRVLRRQMQEALADEPVAGAKQLVPAADGAQVTTWLHAVDADEPRPVVFTLHGGGFSTGDARKTDALAEWISQSYDVHVVDIDYRLAPENPWPVALGDTVAVLDWYAAQADAHKMDRQAFYLMGYSAGANLSVTAALKAEEASHDFALAGLILHYPFLDAATPADQKGYRDVDFPSDLAEAYNIWYLGDNDPANPLISPVFASDDQLRGLPPVHSYPVVGDGCFHDAQVFHNRLAKLGLASTMTPVDGCYHGYIENSANTRVYYKTSFEKTREERPANYIEVAEKTMRESLGSFLGEPVRMVTYSGYTTMPEK